MKVFKVFVFLIFPALLSAQVNISNTTLNICSETIYDDGGPSGNYSTNVDYTMTVCPTSGTQLYFIVNFLSLGTAFNGDIDRLRIFQGTGTGGPVLFNSDNDTPGAILLSNNGCLTIYIETDPHFFSTDPGAGFEILVSCTLPETCSDGILNNGEVQIDCGGPNCQPCYLFTQCAPDVIINGDFETPDPSVCGAPAGGAYGTSNQIPRPWYDQTPVSNWIGTAIRIDNNISYPTADYNNSSCTNSGTVPSMNGSGSLGYFSHFGGGQSSEYIQQLLASPLVAGEEYCVSLKATSGGSRGGTPSDGFGMWFHNRTFASGDGFVEWNNDNGGSPFLGAGTTVNAIPQVQQPIGKNISLAVEDLKFSFCATGGERYVVIGNFTPGPAGSGSSEYITIDDISVIQSCPLTFDCNIIESGVPDCAGSCVTLTADPQNQAGGCEVTNDFTYLWSTGATTQAINVCPTGGGSYYVDITYNAGCKTLTQRCQVTYCGPQVTLVGDTICVGETGTLTATASGTSGYDFLWSGGGVTPGPTNNPSTDTRTDNPVVTTTYTVIVTDINGDKDTATADIVVNPLPNVSADTDAAICIGASTTVTGSGASTYTWDNGVPNGAGPHTVSPATTTTYTVTGTDVNGCVNTDDVTITVNPLPTIVAPDAAGCKNDPITLSASGGTTYSWVPLDGGLINSGANTATPEVQTDQPGAVADVIRNYEVTVTDANGCTNTATVQVTFEVNCGPQVVVDNDTICIGETGTLLAVASAGDGSYTFTWSGGGLTGQTTAGPHNDNPVATTTYTIVVTDGTGAKDTTTAQIIVNPLPNVSADTDAAICIGASTTVTGSGAFTYTWDNGVPNGAGPHTVSPAATTTYTVTGTDVNGCVNTDDVTITVNPLPTIVAPNAADCYLNDITLNASGGNSYNWTALGSPAGVIVSGGSSATPVV
ncbi:MAG: hypothetical protein J5I47_02220, partial [Vicingus serpentipes]|nr:hypothetical protein [Vicingus serpentipes]